MMITIFLFISVVFFATFVLGKLIEKVKIPWIFASLVVGILLAIYNPFAAITNSPEFMFLSELGMYFLLFIIGFELDLSKLRKMGPFILKSTFFIILFEAFFGSLIMRFFFGYDWIISIIVALSFATVGEAILVPVLDEFRIINTKLGQSIISIGSLDDIIEVAIFLLVIILVGGKAELTNLRIGTTILSMLFLFLLTFGLTKLGKRRVKFSFQKIETLFVFILFVFFLFLAIGQYAHASAVAALLAGIAIRTFVPNERLKFVDSELKTMCYGFFAPMFFISVGLSTNIQYLLAAPLMVALVVLVSSIAKILASVIAGRKELGLKDAILLGTGLSVRFSTSIIVVKILLDGGIIGRDIYSIIVASSIVFGFVVPILFANLVVRWKINRQKALGA
ncbi:MAG: cation:proton antiporter [Candidatus Diapherotrites archaeon]|nr:cation:proton antiporter [Candidatus Diapherotrites archaeon]